MDAAASDTVLADEALMCAYRDGEAAAFDSLYARHKDTLYRFVLRNTGEPQAANEVYQDIWMRVINARHGYRPKAMFRTWLFSIAHNRLKDFYRAQARRNARIASADAAPDDLADEAPLPGDVLYTEQVRAALLAGIGTLPHAQREAFLLREEAGLSLAQIAELVGVPRETVKSRLRYAVNRLRASIREKL